MILRDVLLKSTINHDVIFGALSAYLLAGVCWAYVYAFVFLLSPGSFRSAQVLTTNLESPTALENQADAFLYYSFITLSTVGFGDMWPTSRLAQTLSWMEAVAGQLYLAVLVARLVALQTARKEKQNDGA
jgi:hypothetical protein